MSKCAHEPIHDIKNGEVVCIKCGMVLGTIQEDAPVHSEDRQSLYHQAALGGDPRDAKKLKPYIRINSTKDLSEFSNLCDHLQLPDSVKREAWSIYLKLRSLKRHTRATCALYSVFKACYNFGCGISEGRIREAIPHALRVKNIPSLLKALFAFGDIAWKIGISTRRSTYYLNVETASMQDRFARREDFDLFKRLAQTHYQNLSGNDRSRAKRAVTKALSETRPRLRQ